MGKWNYEEVITKTLKGKDATMEFKVLSHSEEEQLSLKEKKEYYNKLREYVLSRKLTNTTPCATTIAPKLKGITTKIALALTKAFTCKNVEWVCEGNSDFPEGAVIFAHTHQGIIDNFVWIPEVDKHCLLLHGQQVNKLLLLCQLNTGLILVKKEDKENNNNAKMDMIRILLEGHSITYFPEGTWNLSPNKLHLPLSFGVIDIAKKARVPIIPVVHECTYDTSSEKEWITKIHSKFGKPIYVNEEDDLFEKLHEYEESISTIRWELLEAKGVEKRSKITNWDYINFLKGNYKNLKLGQLDIERERRNIFGAYSDFYKFHHVNDIPFNDRGELLETEEVRRLKMINRMHGI